jgi:hypothetical protein
MEASARSRFCGKERFWQFDSKLRRRLDVGSEERWNHNRNFLAYDRSAKQNDGDLLFPDSQRALRAQLANEYVGN